MNWFREGPWEFQFFSNLSDEKLESDKKGSMIMLGGKRLGSDNVIYRIKSKDEMP